MVLILLLFGFRFKLLIILALIIIYTKILYFVSFISAYCLLLIHKALFHINTLFWHSLPFYFIKILKLPKISLKNLLSLLHMYIIHKSISLTDSSFISCTVSPFASLLYCSNIVWSLSSY